MIIRKCGDYTTSRRISHPSSMIIHQLPYSYDATALAAFILCCIVTSTPFCKVLQVWSKWHMSQAVSQKERKQRTKTKMNFIDILPTEGVFVRHLVTQTLGTAHSNIKKYIVMVPSLSTVMNSSVTINTGRTFISVAVSSTQPNALAVRLTFDTLLYYIFINIPCSM